MLATIEITRLIRTVQADQDRHDVNDAVAVLIQHFAHYVTAPHARRGIVDSDELDAIAATAIWQAAQRFDLTRDASTFGTFAFTVTQRRVTDYLRRQAVQTGRQDHYELQPDDAPTKPHNRLDELQAEEQTERLQRELTNIELAVFRGRRAGLSFGEISRSIKRSIKAVDNASGRIRQKFVMLFGQGPALA